MLKNRIAYGILLCFTIGLAVCIPGKATVSFVVLLLALLLFSFLQGYFTFRRLEIQQSLSQDSLQKRQRITYQITIFCKNSFCPLLKLDFSSDTKVLGDLQESYCSAKHKQQLNYLLTGKYRGRYQVGLESITFYDFLDIFFWKKQIGELLTCKVFPKLTSLQELQIPVGTSTSHKLDLFTQVDYTSIAELKQYQPQDHMKDIHWKASAKRNELLVKHYEHFNQEKTTVLFDLTPMEYIEDTRLELEDRMVSVGLSLLHYLSKDTSVPVQLVYADDQIRSCGEERSVVDLLELAAFLPFKSQIEIVPLLKTMQQRENNGTVLIVTNALDEPLVDYIFEQQVEEKTFGVFYCSVYSDPNYESKEKWKELLVQRAIPCFEIKHGRGIRSQLEQVTEYGRESIQ